jgi:hypothetical protein
VAFDHHYWARHFREQFAPYLRLLTATLTDRLLPAFGDIEAEAEAVTEAEYNRLGQLPADDSIDMADAAEMARDEGIGHYEAMTSLRQALLNLYAVALYHAFEQQLLVFHRRQVLSPMEEHDPKLFSISVLAQRLTAKGINLTALASYPAIAQLRLAANTVKHADGTSATALRQQRPDLFHHPIFHLPMEGRLAHHVPVYSPLLGDDVYITVASLVEWTTACCDFWDELGTALGAVAA